MARPSIPDEKYYEAFNELVSSGKKLEKITATDIQNSIGGRFSKARMMLEKIITTLDKEKEKTPDQPDWFKEPLKHLGNKLWHKVSQEIRIAEDSAKDNFECKAKDFEVNKNELLQQISVTENEMEIMSDEIEKLKKELAQEQGRRKQAEELYQKLNDRLLTSEKELGELKGKLDMYERQDTLAATS